MDIENLEEQQLVEDTRSGELLKVSTLYKTKVTAQLVYPVSTRTTSPRPRSPFRVMTYTPAYVRAHWREPSDEIVAAYDAYGRKEPWPTTLDEAHKHLEVHGSSCAPGSALLVHDKLHFEGRADHEHDGDPPNLPGRWWRRKELLTPTHHHQEQEQDMAFHVEIHGEYGENDGDIHLMDGDEELVMWDSAEWIEDPSLVFVIANAIRKGYSEGPNAIRARIGVHRRVALEQTQRNALIALLQGWITDRARWASEHSLDFVADYRVIVESAKKRANTLGVPWSDALVPSHVRDALNDADND
jgi:hypothetical protein